MGGEGRRNSTLRCCFCTHCKRTQTVSGQGPQGGSLRSADLTHWEGSRGHLILRSSLLLASPPLASKCSPQYALPLVACIRQYLFFNGR